MTDNLMGSIYRMICDRHRPETIQRHENRLVGAIYVRAEALRAIARRLEARERGKK